MSFDLVRLLTGRPAGELAGAARRPRKAGDRRRQPVIRQLGFVALIAADGNVDKAWALAPTSVSALQDLVGAMPLIRDPGLRASLYPKIEPLLQAACRRSWLAANAQGRHGPLSSASSCPAGSGR